MKITNKQLIMPGALDISDKHRKRLYRYKKAIEHSRFLTGAEKRRWMLLGYILTTQQLIDAERLIISEDLRVMKIKQQLELIKPTPATNV